MYGWHCLCLDGNLRKRRRPLAGYQIQNTPCCCAGCAKGRLASGMFCRPHRIQVDGSMRSRRQNVRPNARESQDLLLIAMVVSAAVPPKQVLAVVAAAAAAVTRDHQTTARSTFSTSTVGFVPTAAAHPYNRIHLRRCHARVGGQRYVHMRPGSVAKVPHCKTTCLQARSRWRGLGCS